MTMQQGRKFTQAEAQQILYSDTPTVELNERRGAINLGPNGRSGRNQRDATESK